MAINTAAPIYCVKIVIQAFPISFFVIIDYSLFRSQACNRIRHANVKFYGKVIRFYILIRVTNIYVEDNLRRISQQ